LAEAVVTSIAALTRDFASAPACLCYAARVKSILTIAVSLWMICPVAAQELEIDPDEVIQSVQGWIEDNLDQKALDELGVDKDRVQRFLGELRKRFQGTYLYDLGALKETSLQILPLLDQFEETRPYAVWLRSHLDYFDVSEELRREVKPAPEKPRPARLPSPSPILQRSVWVRELKDRSRPPLADIYAGRLKEIFAAEKLPPELVWVAEVESSFDPSARSPAGAAGLFQLMPVTARGLNLSTSLPDERLHPEKSARAAARYLHRLYDRFGDWRLALAAYNAGESRVESLLKKSKTRSFDAIADRLPAETQMFVPKVEAVLRRREGVALAELRLPDE
jgi:membrane-bound lytic murein transglycosylase D